MIFYLDCDTGIDDALAIGLLLAHDDVTLAGIGTVNGNTSAVQAAANTAGLLELAGRPEIPVAVGPGGHGGGARRVHGGNGVGGVRLPAGPPHDPRSAPALLVDLAREHPGELHVLATGPAGNLAAALRAEPRLPGLIASVTVMGGAVRVPGNVNSYAEANAAGDPAALAAVIAAPWPVTLVPLDVTLQHRWTPADQQALAGRSTPGHHPNGPATPPAHKTNGPTAPPAHQSTGPATPPGQTGDRSVVGSATPLNRALAAMLTVYFDFYETRFGVREIPLHDPLAAGIAVGEVAPGDAPGLGLRIDLTDGRVVEDPGAATRVRVVLSLTAPAGPVILRRLLGGAGAGRPPVGP